MVSIIVPVYNTDKYLSYCVESILSQTFMAWECILVNDGSLDNSGALCDDYALKDERIRVFHQRNEGATSARRKAVENARGEWITFVDSDDELYPDALERLMAVADENVDIIEGMINRARRIDKDIFRIEEYRRLCILGQVFTTGPVAKLYRRSLFDSFVLDVPSKLIVGEDYIMRIRLAFRSDKPVMVIHTPVYYYRPNPNSVMNRYHRVLDHEYLFFQSLVSSVPSECREEYLREIFRCGYQSYQLLLSCSSFKQITAIHNSRFAADLRELQLECGVRSHINTLSNPFLSRIISPFFSLIGKCMRFSRRLIESFR